MNPKWYQMATAELGQQEVRGSAHNPRIVEYQQATGLAARDDETAWCGSFVAWCLAQTGIPYDRASAASARAWLRWGREMREPTIGCVVVFWRGSKGGWQGHVGFYAGRTDAGAILVLGGNQGDRVSVAPYPASQLLGYRWPDKEPLPVDVQPLRQSGVIRGASTAVAGAAVAIAEQAPELVRQIDSAQQRVETGTVLGLVAAAVILAGAGWAIWSRVRGKRQAREGGA